MRVVVVGAGVVGTATGMGFLRHGVSTSFVDVKRSRVATLSAEGCSASERVDLGGDDDVVVMLSVPTPSGPAPLGYDLSYLAAAAASVGSAIAEATSFVTVLVRSTVPPGTAEGLVQPILEERSGRPVGDGYSIGSNPEFLRARCALEDFLHPRVTVVGSRSKATLERLAQLYRPLGGELRLFDDPATAELVKITHNLFNSAKISFWNEMWLMARSLGLEAGDVAETVALSAEASWNPAYGTRGGEPFGGACLPKDTRGYLAFAEQVGCAHPLASAIESVNELLLLARDAAPDTIDVRHSVDVRDPVRATPHTALQPGR